MISAVRALAHLQRAHLFTSHIRVVSPVILHRNTRQLLNPRSFSTKSSYSPSLSSSFSPSFSRPSPPQIVVPALYSPLGQDMTEETLEEYKTEAKVRLYTLSRHGTDEIKYAAHDICEHEFVFEEEDCKSTNKSYVVFYALARGDYKFAESSFAKSKDLQDSLGNTLLHAAATEYKPDLVKNLIKMGADINARNSNNQSPIFAATSVNNIKDLITLAESGADMNLKDTFGRTALFYSNDTETTKTLIKYGANVNAASIIGCTPLFEIESAEKAKLLLEAGAKVDWKDNRGRQPIHLAKSASVVDILVASGADVNALDINDESPLHLSSPYPDVVAALIKYGAKLDHKCKNSHMCTAMHHAIASGSFDGLEELGKAGADFKYHEDNGSSLLHFCVNQRNNTEELVKVLVKYGANINGDCDTKTPLLKEILNYDANSSVVKLMLELGASLDSRTNQGATPLHLAAMRGNEEIVRILVNAGASLDALTDENQSPLFVAVHEVQHSVIKTLVELGADVNGKIDGYAPLHIAAKEHCEALRSAQNSPEIEKKAEHLTSTAPTAIPTLLKLGADINMVDKFGNTPLHLAYRHRNMGAAAELEAAGANKEIKNEYDLTAKDIKTMMNAMDNPTWDEPEPPSSAPSSSYTPYPSPNPSSSSSSSSSSHSHSHSHSPPSSSSSSSSSSPPSPSPSPDPAPTRSPSRSSPPTYSSYSSYSPSNYSSNSSTANARTPSYTPYPSSSNKYTPPSSPPSPSSSSPPHHPPSHPTPQNSSRGKLPSHVNRKK